MDRERNIKDRKEAVLTQVVTCQILALVVAREMFRPGNMRLQLAVLDWVVRYAVPRLTCPQVGHVPLYELWSVASPLRLALLRGLVRLAVAVETLVLKPVNLVAKPPVLVRVAVVELQGWRFGRAYHKDSKIVDRNGYDQPAMNARLEIRYRIAMALRDLEYNGTISLTEAKIIASNPKSWQKAVKSIKGSKRHDLKAADLKAVVRSLDDVGFTPVPARAEELWNQLVGAYNEGPKSQRFHSKDAIAQAALYLNNYVQSEVVHPQRLADPAADVEINVDWLRWP
ncbi:MAG: hypothetical protein M1831_007194 [Alyxoria varia]|nr:MAG: hypothetical protein M1831_007194 [Alyxoria varia]